MKGQSAMTIKDMEARTGMSRANIRYYEQEGLIAPQRDSNGYRNYQESDVQALERILLMRRLGVSLEDIRALQAGSLPLGEAMERQADKLGREQQEAAAAQAALSRPQGCLMAGWTPGPFSRRPSRPRNCRPWTPFCPCATPGAGIWPGAWISASILCCGTPFGSWCCAVLPCKWARRARSCIP